MRRSAVLVAIAVAVIASGCRREKATSANPNVANKVAVRAVRLYYGSPQMRLSFEPRNVPLPQSPAAAIPVVLRELLKGPASSSVFRLLPPDATVRGAYLLPGGTVVVDLGGPTFTNGWNTGSQQELLAAYSLVETLTANFADAKRVRIVINGTPAETLGGHIWLARSFVPRPALVEPAAQPAP